MTRGGVPLVGPRPPAADVTVRIGVVIGERGARLVGVGVDLVNGVVEHDGAARQAPAEESDTDVRGEVLWQMRRKPEQETSDGD